MGIYAQEFDDTLEDLWTNLADDSEAWQYANEFDFPAAGFGRDEFQRYYKSHYDPAGMLDELDRLKESYIHAPLRMMVGMDKVIGVVKEWVGVHRNSGSSPQMNLAIEAGPGRGKSKLAHAIHKACFRAELISRDIFISRSKDNLNTQGLRDKDEQLTAEAFKHANGGTLFIDEVHHLVTEGAGPASVINVNAEERRGKMVLIVATYPDKMPKFLNKDPGLRRRFQPLALDDYTDTQMVKIFERHAGQRGFLLDGNVMRAALWDYFNRLQRKTQQGFYGGGEAVNLLDRVIPHYSPGVVDNRQDAFNGMTSSAPVLRVHHLQLALEARERLGQKKAYDPHAATNPFQGQSAGQERAADEDPKIVRLPSPHPSGGHQ